MARTNFSRCGGCANGEIRDEHPGHGIGNGYDRFDKHDADVLLESREAWIGYGSFLDSHLREEMLPVLAKH